MDTDLLLTAAAVTATIVACTCIAAAAGNTLYRQSVGLLSIERLAVTITYLATVKLPVH